MGVEASGDASAGDGVVLGSVAALSRGGRLLLIRRAEGIRGGGKWCLPGGGIEPGESSGQAIVREMDEELGLSVRAVRQVWRWTRPDGKLVLDWWVVEAADLQISPDPAEVAEARWLAPDEIRGMTDVLPGLFEFLDEFYPPG